MSDPLDNDVLPGVSLEQLCRALAAHVLMTAHADVLHSAMPPEVAEQTAQFIYRFALGEPLERPRLKAEAAA
jgi:hypothetical protein